MIIVQYPYIDEDGKKDYSRIKHYSDEGKLLRKKEVPLPYAVDSYPCKHEYEEIDDTTEEVGTIGHKNLC